MTKNHILIQSLTLSVVLLLSSMQAAADQARIAYFNQKLFPPQGTTALCPVADDVKDNVIGQLENVCLTRFTQEGQSFLTESKCSLAETKVKVNNLINGICNQAQYNQLKKELQQQQQLAAAAAAGKGTAAAKNAAGITVKGTIAAAQQTFGTYKELKGSKGSEDKKNSDSKGNANGSASAKPAASTNANADVKAPASSTDGGVKAPAASIVEAQTPPKATYSLSTLDKDGKQDGYVNVTNDPAAGLTKLQKFGADGKPMGDVLFAKPDDLEKKYQDLGVDPKGKPYVKASDAAIKANGEIGDKNTQEAGKGALSDNAAAGEDALKTARTEKSNLENAAFKDEMDILLKQVESFRKDAPLEAKMKCEAAFKNGDAATLLKCENEVQAAMTCLDKHVQSLEEKRTKLINQKEQCSTTSIDAEKLCSMVRSEKAQKVQLMMSLGTMFLSKVTAASKACGFTSSLSKVAQGGMLLAQGACSASKMSCDLNCGLASRTLRLMTKDVLAIKVECKLISIPPIAVSGAKAENAAFALGKKLEIEASDSTKSVPAAIAQCEKHAADVAQMGMAALGFMSAGEDADACKEKLASNANAGGGSSTSGLAGPSITTAEYCSVPENASSITCKCTADPNASGCLGSTLSGANSGIALGKVNSGNGASGFASAGSNGLAALNTTSSGKSTEPAPGAGLSAAAREALGIGGSPSGSSGQVEAAQGGGSRNQAAAAKDSSGKPEDKKKEFNFISSLGSMMGIGGKKPDQAAKAAIRNYEQEEAIKRKVASEQVRAEITTASGKSNFDKIKNAYQSVGNSFEQ